MSLQNLVTEITLDVYDHDRPQQIIKSIALDDKSRFINARITNKGETYSVDSSADVTLVVIRPDKVGVMVEGSTYNYDSSYGLTAELNQVALAVPGKLVGQFKVEHEGKVIHTELFTIDNCNALERDTDSWADQYQGYDLSEFDATIQEAVARVTAAEESVEGIAELLDRATHVKDLAIVNGKTVTTTGDVINIDSFNTENGWGCAVDACEPGDVYTITGHGGANTRLWCFVDSNNRKLAVANVGQTEDHLKLVVPPNTAHAVFNFQTNSTYSYEVSKIKGVAYTDYTLKSKNVAPESFRVGEAIDLINKTLSNARANEQNGRIDALAGTAWSLNHISTDDGQNKDNGYNCRTDSYIPVVNTDGKLYYKMTASSGIRLNVFFYDSNKTWLSQDAGTLHTGTYEGSVTLPANTAYIRLLLSNSSWGKYNYISEATNYFEAWFVPALTGDELFDSIYGSRIESVAQGFEANAESARLGYVWISDLHFKTNWTDNTTALKRQLKAVAKIANRLPVDFICIGGDLLDAETNASNVYANINDWLSPLAESNKPVIYLIGNHDDNAYADSLSKGKAKGLIVDRGDFHNDIIAPAPDKAYFYFDIDRKGIRVVCLDTIDYEGQTSKDGTNWWSLSQEQVEWFCETAVATDKDIVILSHMCPEYDYNCWHLGDEGGYHTDLMNVIQAYNNKSSISLYGKTFDFSSAEGRIRFMHVGHTHFEPVIVPTVGGIPCIFTSCAKQYDQGARNYETAVSGQSNTYYIPSGTDYSAHHQNYIGYQYRRFTNRTLGTINESLFDVVSVNANAVNVYRVGAGVDRQIPLS